MKLRRIGILLVMLGVLVTGCAKEEIINEKLRKVRLGMTMAEVKEITGEPMLISIRTEDGKVLEVWLYDGGHAASAFSIVKFNKKEGVVVKVRTDNIHLFKKNAP
jgi:hypothetical protein